MNISVDRNQSLVVYIIYNLVTYYFTLFSLTEITDIFDFMFIVLYWMDTIVVDLLLVPSRWFHHGHLGKFLDFLLLWHYFLLLWHSWAIWAHQQWVLEICQAQIWIFSFNTFDVSQIFWQRVVQQRPKHSYCIFLKELRWVSVFFQYTLNIYTTLTIVPLTTRTNFVSICIKYWNSLFLVKNVS